MNVRDAARRWFSNDRQRTAVQDRYERAVPVVEAAVDADYIDKVREAWEQWQAAQNYFESVSDPDLVDYAIYDMEASRRRYIYMLKQVEQ